MARARRAWPDVVAAVLVGAAVFAFFGRAFLNYDSFYALVWGNDLASGNDTPDDSLARKIALGNEVGLDAAMTAHKTSAMTAQVLQLMSDQAEREAYARRWQDAYARQVLAKRACKLVGG